MHIDERRVGIAISDKPLISSHNNYYDCATVSMLVHNSLLYAGFGEADTRSPLIDIIQPGMTVLLKPNWVIHYNYSGKGMECLVTHPVFIESVVEEVLKARPGKIVIADAPIQMCDMDSLVNNDWKRRIKSLSEPVEISFVDFRRTVTKAGRIKFSAEENIRSDDSFVLFDLGKESLLDQISSPDCRFRVTCYNPEKLAETHNADSHKYLISKEVFEADVIINLPKLKCHKKAGITAALKNLVGINGNKDYLPHHRLGGSLQKGDCYEGKSALKYIAELCYDYANRNINKNAYYLWKAGASLAIRAQLMLFGEAQIEGSWFGNDTVWRMVLDLNRIALYGNIHGALSGQPLRKIFSITDGIIAGEGNGPLAPEPVKLGAVTCASSSAFADVAHAALMKYDMSKIALIHNAFDSFNYPLTHFNASDIMPVVNGVSCGLQELIENYGIKFTPPDGWKGHIELATQE
jgi:uncharacterized protein (DUF362 family)